MLIGKALRRGRAHLGRKQTRVWFVYCCTVGALYTKQTSVWKKLKYTTDQNLSNEFFSITFLDLKLTLLKRLNWCPRVLVCRPVPSLFSPRNAHKNKQWVDCHIQLHWVITPYAGYYIEASKYISSQNSRIGYRGFYLSFIWQLFLVHLIAARCCKHLHLNGVPYVVGVEDSPPWEKKNCDCTFYAQYHASLPQPIE